MTGVTGGADAYFSLAAFAVLFFDPVFRIAVFQFPIHLVQEAV